jgi:hypothetical protein
MAAEGSIVTEKNRHIGSSFESWLDEAGLREDATKSAIRAVTARLRTAELRKNTHVVAPNLINEDPEKTP